MATFEVELDGKLVKTFEAEDYWEKDGQYVFVNADNDTVGSIITKPGMSVVKLSKANYGRPI